MKPPVSIMVVSWLLIVGGAFGIASHVKEFHLQHLQNDMLWIVLTNVTAIVCGLFMLRGSNWARWIAMVWLAFHVIISSDSGAKLAVHGLLFAVFGYLLFRAPASEFFRRHGAAAA
jgi:hypothetical protein